jgi:ABC-2 type transport system ATP-binding protein
MIQAQGLVKRYGDITALDGIDMHVQQGHIYALLGPNGAGKTTTISILTTLIRADSGSAQVAGHDIARQPHAVRSSIGVTFQDLVLDRDLSGREVLDVHGRLYNQSRQLRERRIAELVGLVQLGDAIDRRVKTYSGGMKRRLELARGLMTDPQVLFLDEPTQGLDPQNRTAIWDYVRTLSKQQGLTLLLTTHFMEEAEALADVVGIIDHGRKVAEGPPAALAAELGADVINIVGRGDDAHFLEQIRILPFVDQISRSEGDHVITIGVDNGARRLAEIVQHAGGNGFVIEDISVARPKLGDVFLKYTGRALRD